MKSKSLIAVNKILDKEIFTTDKLTIGEMVNTLGLEWTNLDEDVKGKVVIALLGMRNKDGANDLFKGYLDRKFC